MSNDYPLAAILAYGGELDTLPEGTPWYSCEGQFFPPDELPALSDLIGMENGGDQAGNFALPDYRGQFLRGQDAGRSIDKDAGKKDGRQSPATGETHPGNHDDAVGSVQSSDIGMHSHEFYYRSSSLQIQNGNAHSPHAAQEHNTDSSGTANDGDGESRPKNIAVNFLILGKYPTSTRASTPVGAIIAYAGPLTDSAIAVLLKQGWLPCDGKTYDKHVYKSLFDAIATNHGGLDVDHFAVPDLRGVFLRGLSSGTNRDPGPRRTPRDDLNDPGNKEGGVGSYEDDGNQTHDHSYQTWSGDQQMIDFWEWTVVGPGTQDRTSSTIGNVENRPINLSTNFLICYANSDTGDDAARKNGVSFAVPTGAVIPYAADSDQAHPGWLVCNGDSCPREGSSLFGVIDTAYGAPSDVKFNVPDYRGMFLRGLDVAGTRDTQVTLRDFSKGGSHIPGNNGAKVGSLQQDSYRAHSHTYQFNNDEHRTNYGTGAECVGATSDSTNTGSTGIYETRPRNTYVVYLIKSV